NKDKKNRLMRIAELHKFNDRTLIDVRTTLDDRLKGIRMRYLPQTIWRKSDKDGAAAMIQAIDKRLKKRRVMRSLERTMDTTINQQAAMDEALFLRILGYGHKKHIVNLESFRDMLHICPRIPGQSFDEPPFEEEILAFIRSPMNTQAYKEYYAIATGEAAPKPKASAKRARSGSDTSINPPTTAASPRLTAFAKVKQTTKVSKAKSLYALSEVAMIEAQQLKLATKDEESFDPIPQTPKSSEDEGDGKEDQGLNIGEEERLNEEEETDELYRDVNINKGRGMESIFVTASTSVAPLPITAPTMTPSTIATITITSQAPILPTTVSSDIIQHLPSFGSLFCFDDRLRSLEENFSEFRQTNQFAGAVSAILRIVHRYMNQQMNEEIRVDAQIQSDRLRDEAQKENDEFLRSVDENMKKIIKEQVKEQVKVQVSKILPRIEQAMNEQLEAKVLTRSSHSSRTSYAVAADLSEMELKKILIEKIEGNKSNQRSDEQRNLYKALVEAYEADKIILDTYGETVTLKRRRDDDADKDEGPSVGPDRGSKGRRECKEPESASTPSETAIRSVGRSTTGSKSRQASTSESALVKEPVQTTSQMEEPSHLEFDTCADDQPIIQSS
nr:hypothetical protein [Tanacetum cinerariifolium]